MQVSKFSFVEKNAEVLSTFTSIFDQLALSSTVSLAKTSQPFTYALESGFLANYELQGLFYELKRQTSLKLDLPLV